MTIFYAGKLLYAKGHIDRGAFLEEASAQYGLTGYTETDIEHTYLRKVPSSHYSEYDMLLYRCKQGRGACPVTLLERD